MTQDIHDEIRYKELVIQDVSTYLDTSYLDDRYNHGMGYHPD